MAYERSMSYKEFSAIISRYPDDAEWKRLARAGEKVPSIKSLRTEEGYQNGKPIFGLREAKDTMEVYLEWYARDMLPQYVPVTSTVIQLDSVTSLTVNTNLNGTYSVERTQRIYNNLTHSELLKIIAQQALAVHNGPMA